MPTETTYITYATRTPVGKFMGGLSTVPAPRLGAHLVKDALLSSKIPADMVDEVIMGQVLTAGCGQAPARQTAIYGGLPPSVRATTINRVCGSGIKSVMMADQAIRLGDAGCILAGGQENMSLAPHLMMNSRSGYRFGNAEVKDHMQFDGLWDPYGDVPMGQCAELCAKEFQFTRDEQDAFALQSYERAKQAWESKAFANEVIPVEVPGRKGSILVDKDEEPFSVDLSRLSGLRPAFDKSGTVTAGNASSINDGAALLMLASESVMQRHSLKPLAKIVAQGSHARQPEWFTTAPIGCIDVLLEKSGLKSTDIDLWEINEAFAAVTMAAIKELKLNPEQVNIHGGAVALGHPIGASGARVLVTLIHALKQKNLKRGLATLCIGGGEASGVIIEMI